MTDPSAGRESDPSGGNEEPPLGIDPGRTPAQNATLALLLEVAGTPKPGNVDRRRDLGDLHFEQFLAGAVGAAPGLGAAESGAPLGPAFERAVAGMSRQSGGNTQFGCLLLLVPLVRAATRDLSPKGVTAVVESTTVDDAVAFYRAFEHVAVAVDDPPEDAAALDVCRGAAAESDLRERGTTWYDVMELSAGRDANAREWTGGFGRVFGAAAEICDDDGPVADRAARAFLGLLAQEPDTLVAIEHGDEVAEAVRERAAAVGTDLGAAEAFAESLVDRGINPGTTADLTAAALFVALERGVSP